MVTQQRMQGAPNVAPCMRLAEEVLSHFDLLCQSALTQKKRSELLRIYDITVRCVGVARVVGVVMRTPSARFIKEVGADRCRPIAPRREMSRLTTKYKEYSVSDCQRTLRRNAVFANNI